MFHQTIKIEMCITVCVNWGVGLMQISNIDTSEDQLREALNWQIRCFRISFKFS